MSSLPINLESLIHGRSVESSRIEFKATWNQVIRSAVIRTVCAFANDLLNQNGGYIVLGVEQDEHGNPMLPPRGLEGLDLDQVQREIRGQCRRIEPEYQPVLSPEIMQDRKILVIWAPAGDTIPYQAPRDLDSGRGDKA